MLVVVRQNYTHFVPSEVETDCYHKEEKEGGNRISATNSQQEETEAEEEEIETDKEEKGTEEGEKKNEKRVEL